MGKNRLEAFSDGVLAIIITIMVLELKRPEGSGLTALRPLVPVLSSYVLSFIYIGIYWNNHHHLFHAARRVNGAVLWANLHLLFWLSLFPVATEWMGSTGILPGPTSAYGFVLFMAAVAYAILQSAIIAGEGPSSLVKAAVGHDWKGKLSPVIYLAGIVLAYIEPRISVAGYVFVALLWLAPDRRIERLYRGHQEGE